MLDGWHDFFVAEVSASAALAGLLFVALSINIKQIIEISWLPNRAAQSLIVFMTALLMGAVMLFPGQNAMELVAELGGIIVVSLAVDVPLGFTGGVVDAEYSRHVHFNIALNALFYVASFAGIILTYFGNSGITVIAATTLYALCYGMFNAWVLLVEILR